MMLAHETVYVPRFIRHFKCGFLTRNIQQVKIHHWNPHIHTSWSCKLCEITHYCAFYRQFSPPLCYEREVDFTNKQYCKAYDTRSDMLHTTCCIRQNLGMSDRVSPPKTPRDTIRQCCKKNRTCSIFIRLQPTLSNGQTNQMGGICTRGYVYVLCVCSRADMFPYARCKYGLT